MIVAAEADRETPNAGANVHIAARLRAPEVGLVSRRPLVERVSVRGGRLIMVVAPSGYGKSTFLAELARDDDRPSAWLTLSRDDGPASLLAHITSALDRIEPVDPRHVSTLWSRSANVDASARDTFGAMFTERERPFTLVLDDVHVLRRRDSLDVLAALVAEVPAGCRLALAGRWAPDVPLGRVRTSGQLVEIGPEDLAFDESEIVALFDLLTTTTCRDGIASLVERSEGWPVAVHLAILAHNTRTYASATPVSAFDGTHRFLVDYLRDEVFAAVDDDIASFLLEASCLERMSGAMCDDVLDRIGSAELLDRARRRNLLVLPLDDRREWYRFHSLMASFLHNELRRRDVTRLREIHRRASDWCQAHGDADGAISHALRSDDLARAESLALHWPGRVPLAGRDHTIDGWLSSFTPEALDTHPGFMISAAYASFTDGDPMGAVRRLTHVRSVMADRHPPGALGPVAPVVLALTHAIIAPLTPTEMIEESRYAHDRVGAGVGHARSCLALGAAEFLIGDEDSALDLFAEGAATAAREPIIEGTCLAHISIIHIVREDWGMATIVARQARAVIGDQTGPSAALVLAVSVLVETQAGRAHAVEADRRSCRQHLASLVGVAPWLNVQARIVLSHAATLVGDSIEASTSMAEAEQLAVQMPEAVSVHRQLAALRHIRHPGGNPQGSGPSSLTTAELRVLQFLPTHLSSVEIGKRLYVSRSTVKTQIISIYRKLGTNSRSDAVEAAVAAGLLPGPSAPR